MKKLKNKITLLITLITSLNGIAQSQYIARWAYGFGNACYNNSVVDIKTDLNGNHIVTGTFGGFDAWSGDPAPDIDFSANTYTLPAGLTNDFFIAKYTPDGDFMSAFVIGGAGVEACNSITIDNNNDIIATGVFNNTVDFDPSAATQTVATKGLYDVFIAKYTNTGSLLWVKTIGGTGNDKGVRVVTDNQNNIYLTGAFNGTVDIDPSAATTNAISSNGLDDIFITKFDPNGNLLAAKNFGGTGQETVVDIVLDADKKLYMTGTFSTTVDFDPSALGSYTLTDVGNYGDTYFSKFDSVLTFEWVKQLTCSRDNYPKDINIDNTGNVLMAGYYSSLPVDIDPSPLTTYTFTDTKNNFGYISKYDNMGNFLWGGFIAGSSSQQSNESTSPVNVWSDNTGNVYILVKYAGEVDFDFSSTATYTLNNQSFSSSMFYAKYTSTGTFTEVKSLSTSFIYPFSSHTDAQGSLLVVGRYNQNVNMDPSGSNPLNIQYGGVCQSLWGFLAKYNSCNTPSITSVSTATNTVCAGSTVTLNITGSLNDAADWQWSQNSCTSNTIGLGSSIVVTPSANTTYNVKGVGACAGKFLACNTISISTISQPTLIVTSIPANYTVCPNQTFTLSAAGAQSYTWSEGSTTSSITGSITGSSTYSVAGTNTLGCTSSKTIALSVYSVQPLNIATSPIANKDSVCKGEPVLLVSPAAGISTYTWTGEVLGTFGITHNSSVYLGKIQLYVYHLDTTCVFTLYGTNANGCIASGDYTITVNSCVGVREYSLDNNAINMYPNPTNNIVNFESDKYFIDKIVIFNQLSQPIVQEKINYHGTDNSLNLDYLSSGIYTVIFYEKEKQIAVKKIIKN